MLVLPRFEMASHRAMLMVAAPQAALARAAVLGAARRAGNAEPEPGEEST